MRAYWAIIEARFRMLLQYRAAAIAGFGTQLAWGFMMVMVLAAFYDASRSRQPISREQAITYIWLGQAFLGMLPWNVEPDLRVLISSGGVVYELLRPLDLYAHWYSRSLAHRTAPTLLRAVPMLVVAGLFLGLKPPASWESGAAWVVATIGALLLGCAITTLMTISMLWTITGEGITHLTMGAVTLLSGMVIPLPLFPDWSQRLLSLLPFRGLVDYPFRLYSGNLPPEAVWYVLAHQFGWCLALILLGRWILARGVRRMVVQGG